jgi:hypothetical protein
MANALSRAHTGNDWLAAVPVASHRACREAQAWASSLSMPRFTRLMIRHSMIARSSSFGRPGRGTLTAPFASTRSIRSLQPRCNVTPIRRAETG